MDGRNEGRLTSDKRKRVSLHQNPYSREQRGKMVEGSKRIRKRLLRTTTIYLHGQLSFVSSPMELDRDLDRRVEERRLNEETALESGGWSGGKKSKKASG